LSRLSRHTKVQNHDNRHRRAEKHPSPARLLGNGFQILDRTAQLRAAFQKSDEQHPGGGWKNLGVILIISG